MGYDAVSLVIPGRNCERTVGECLRSVVPLWEANVLREIIFVDDGSVDGTAQIAGGFPVTVIRGERKGPGSARNLGWRAARHPLIWFIDSDCAAEPDALDKLLPHLVDPRVGGVSGSYGIQNPESLLACLIHEEIMERHRGMATRVNFLATFNVLYRRCVLEEVGGFDERFLKAQDAELSFRVQAAGYELRFEPRSRVWHYHPTRWLGYLRTQRQQGYWRVGLHLLHRGHATGDSYSSLLDHLQPPLALLCMLSLPLLFVPRARWVSLILWVALALGQMPLTMRMVLRLRSARYLFFSGLGFLRAFYRGVGMAQGGLAFLWRRLSRRRTIDHQNDTKAAEVQA